MNTEQERADFEAWFEESDHCFGKFDFCLMSDGRYEDICVEVAWEAYQAGRAALQSQDREDAERYRRLRDGQIDDIAVVRGLGATDYGSSGVIGIYEEEIGGDDLDEAIDHAIQQRDEKRINQQEERHEGISGL